MGDSMVPTPCKFYAQGKFEWTARFFFYSLLILIGRCNKGRACRFAHEKPLTTLDNRAYVIDEDMKVGRELPQWRFFVVFSA
jgi:hypothetical protein